MKKPLPTLKEVFLRENEMSQRYGLDASTPKGVYVPAMTQNKVIASTAEEPIDECGCEPEEPDFSRVGAPGGPNFGGQDGAMAHGPSIPDMDHGHGEHSIVLFDMDDDPYESSVYGTGGPMEGGLGGPEQEEQGYEDPEGEEDYYKRIAGYYDEPHDKFANDWKPRPRVSEAFGAPIDDTWLEIG